MTDTAATIDTTTTIGTDGTQAMMTMGPEAPGLTIVFRILAVAQMFGGLIMCATFWPGDPTAGYDWKPVAYATAWTWLSAGVVFGSLFWAVGDVLLYLRDIRRSLESGAASKRPKH